MHSLGRGSNQARERLGLRRVFASPEGSVPSFGAKKMLLQTDLSEFCSASRCDSPAGETHIGLWKNRCSQIIASVAYLRNNQNTTMENKNHMPEIK